MKLAIILWYMEYQNEPSKPNERLVELPDDPAKRDELLIAMYRDECGDDDPGEVTVSEERGYGDLQVSDGSGTHMFVTFALLPGEEILPDDPSDPHGDGHGVY